MTGKAERRKRMAQAIADNPNLAPEGAVEVGYMLRDFLEAAVVDDGTAVDTGAGLTSFDLWATIGGKEFYIEIKKSGNQLAAEAGL